MKRQVALLLILSSVLEYDYFVYSDTESSDSSVNLSGGDKLFRNPTNFVCSNLNDSIASQDNLTKCFNTSLINEDAIATTELYRYFNEQNLYSYILLWAPNWWSKVLENFTIVKNFRTVGLLKKSNIIWT